MDVDFFSTWSIGILLSALGKERPFLAYLRIGNCLSFLKLWQCFFKSFLGDCYFFFLFMVMLMHYLYLFCSLLPNFTIVLFLVIKYVLNTHEATLSILLTMIYSLLLIITHVKANKYQLSGYLVGKRILSVYQKTNNSNNNQQQQSTFICAILKPFLIEMH